ncbi:MAG: NnrU family protein [Pseudomonadota bacterium]
MIWLILGLLLFLGMHSAQMAFAGVRTDFIEKRGDGAWKGVYSLTSIVGLVLLIWGYGQARVSDWNLFFYATPSWAPHVVAPLVWLALILVMASQFPAGRIKAAVKHPMILGVKIWAFAHLLANGDLASYLLFGAFLAWAIWNRINLKHRGDPNYGTVAIQYDVISAVVGTILFVVLFAWGHIYLFGVNPWPV